MELGEWAALLPAPLPVVVGGLCGGVLLAAVVRFRRDFYRTFVAFKDLS